MSSVVPVLEVVNLEGLDFRVQCQSVLHEREGKPPHDAHWVSISPCLNDLPVCEERRRLCREHGGWRCTVDAGGCTAFHECDVIDWERVPQ